MQKEIISNPRTGDQYLLVHHPSGLDILICEMDGFSTTEALFATKYGSINTRFRTAQDPDICVVPEGIAHFLEHKLFENEDCDAFTLYAKTGADANAYTDFDKTCYLFSCSDHYQESLGILLSFVQEPYFTQASVDKEQGIIGQEIRMIEDDPSWRVLFNLLKAMYHNHPVRIDIGGTVESIAKIDADLLYRCYNTFYNLHNMVLVVAGNVKADEVLKIADEKLKPCKDLSLETFFPEEPADVVKHEVTDHAAVGLPLFQIGFKSQPASGIDLVRAELECYVAISVLADPASPLYRSMLEEQLINSAFSFEVFTGDGYFANLFGGESADPYTVRDRILAEIARCKREGLDRAHFESVKKACYGSMLRESNNVGATATNLMNAHLAGVKPYDSLQILADMTYEQVQQALCTRFDPERVVLSVVEKE